MAGGSVDDTFKCFAASFSDLEFFLKEETRKQLKGFGSPWPHARVFRVDPHIRQRRGC